MNHNGNYSGRVIDETGEGLPSANVYLTNSEKGDVPSGTVNGTTTDADGYFNMSQFDMETYRYIVASFVGYKKNIQELIQIEEQNILFRMQDSSTALDEFVVTVDGKKKLNWKRITISGLVLATIVTMSVLLIKKYKK